MDMMTLSRSVECAGKRKSEAEHTFPEESLPRHYIDAKNCSTCESTKWCSLLIVEVKGCVSLCCFRPLAIAPRVLMF